MKVNNVQMLAQFPLHLQTANGIIMQSPVVFEMKRKRVKSDTKIMRSTSLSFPWNTISNYCIGLDSFTFHLKDDWWLHNYAICSLQMNKIAKRAEDTPEKCTVQGGHIIGLQHRVARDLSSCVIRHYPCSRWFQGGGKCSKQNQVDTKWGGGMNQVFCFSLYYILFLLYIMFIMGNRTLYIYIIAGEGLKEKVGVIKPKWK